MTHTDDYNRTALYLAASHGYADIVELLLRVDTKAIGKPTEVADFGSDHPLTGEQQGWTPLHACVSSGSIPCIELLAKFGQFVNALDSHGRTPLHLAVLKQNRPAMAALLDQSADINFNSFLLLKDVCDMYVDKLKAPKRGEKPLVQELLDRGCNPNAVENNCKKGTTVLHYAAKEKRVVFMRAMISYGANLFMPDKVR